MFAACAAPIPTTNAKNVLTNTLRIGNLLDAVWLQGHDHPIHIGTLIISGLWVMSSLAREPIRLWFYRWSGRICRIDGDTDARAASVHESVMPDYRACLSIASRPAPGE
jgi:hypothetical protein